METPEATACHEGRIDLEDPRNEGAPQGTGTLTAQFVHYPACQQLQVWLPQSGYAGYGSWRRIAEDGSIAAQGPVSHVLSGSVQMLFDTLDWPPGSWRLEIDHEAGWKHVLAMRKHPEQAAQAAPVPAPSPSPAPVRGRAGRRKSVQGAVDTGHAPVYRDGSGRVIVDEERLFRERAHALLAERFARKVAYEGYGRAGTYTWTEGDRRIRFGQEMGAGTCKAIVLVPTPAQWEADTGLPLDRRDEILRCVAEQARGDFGSRFEIGAGSIDIY